MLIYYVTLWPWPLTRWPWKFVYIKRNVIQVCTKFERYRAIPGWIIDNFANFCTRYVTMWVWPLTSWPWTFAALDCHAFKLCTKFEQNRMIHGCAFGWQPIDYRWENWVNRSYLAASLQGGLSHEQNVTSVGLSVRLSAPLTNAWIVTKRKKVLPRLLYHMKQRLC